MADDKKEIPVGERVIGEMTADEFFGLMMMVMEKKHQDTKEPMLQNLTVREFTEHMLLELKNGALLSARAEAEVSQRILTDWQGLAAVDAVSQPWRIRTEADLDRFTSNLRENIRLSGGRTSFVLALAVEKHVYTPHPPPKE